MKKFMTLLFVCTLLSSHLFAQTTLQCGESGTEEISPFCYNKADFDSFADARDQFEADILGGYECLTTSCNRPNISTCSPSIDDAPSQHTTTSTQWCFSGTSNWSCSECTRIITPDTIILDTIIGEPYPGHDLPLPHGEILVDPLPQKDIDHSNDIPEAGIKKIFPNPTRDKIRVLINTIEQQNEVMLVLFNTTGKIVKTKRYDTEGISTFNAQMNLENIPAGLYFLSVQVNNKLLASTKLTKL